MSPRTESREPARFRHALGALLVVTLVTVMVILPCFLLSRGYERVMDRPITVPVILVVAFLWNICVYVFFRLIGRQLARRKEREVGEHPSNMFDEVMEALDRIGGGDYNVYVTKQGNYHYSELADKVNKLAKDLSSMEQMRQEFVSNVSHEIQSPLTSISGFATLLKKEDLSEEQRHHYLAVIESESKRLSGLSENLLRLSLLDSEQTIIMPQAFRLDKQLEQILLMLEPQWSGKQLELEVRLSPVTLEGDEDLLGQVWVNLLHNAIKFTSPGGSVAVAANMENGKIRCTVTDTGCGIPQESLPRIFERFYKADKSRDRSLGGNGLGLSLVKKIVELHAGRIEVKSQPDMGSTFIVTLTATGSTNE